MRFTFKHGLFSFLLVLASLMFSLVVAELGLRLADFSYYWPIARSPDPLTGWSAKPGTTGWQRLEGSAFVRINADGWRDISHSLTPSTGHFRIAVLGDSFTEAVQVPLEKSYWRTLETLLPQCAPPAIKNKIEILGFGISGYSTAQELLVLENRLWKYQPDLIILAFFTGNDLVENSRSLGKDDMRPYFNLQDGVLRQNREFLQSQEYQSKSHGMGKLFFTILTNSRLFQAFSLAKYQLQIGTKVVKQESAAGPTEPGVDVQIYKAPTTEQWRSAWETTEALINRMHVGIKKNQAKFLLVTLTNGAQVHPNPAFRAYFQQQLQVPNLFYADERIRKLGLASGFLVLNLAQDFQKFATKNGVWLHGFKNSTMGIGHWNEDGHLLAGQRIASFLCYNTELISK
jgi:hypothetical protein